jgi:hypothetical protein
MNGITNENKSKSTTRICEIGKQKYKVVSYYIGEKNIDKVLEDLAIEKALYEYNYEGGFKETG